MLKVSTLNVNGIRAAARKGMRNWLEIEKPDVLLLQEVRAPELLCEELLADMDEDCSWRVASYASQIKGRAGVAVAVRNPNIKFGEIRRGLGEGELPVDSGRWLEVKLEGLNKPLRVVSLYAHSGEINTPKMEQKYQHFESLNQRMLEIIEESRKTGIQTLVAGDFNIVRSEIDIKNWKPNHNKTSGVLDSEIKYLNYWFDTLGWRDVVRDLHGDVPGPYSWWSWRGRAFDNNAGWRIDYQIATDELARQASVYRIHKANSVEERFSDHAPVTVEYNEL